MSAMAQLYHHDQQSITSWMDTEKFDPDAVPKVSSHYVLENT